METLQTAYRDEEDDSETTTPDSNPIPDDPNPNPLTAVSEPDPIPKNSEPESNSDPMEVEFAEKPKALGLEADKTMDLLGSEADGKVGALGSDTPRKVENLGSEDAGNVGALGSEAAGKVGALGSKVSETVEVLGSEELSPGSNSEAELNNHNGLDDNPETSKKQKSIPLDQFDEFASISVSTDNMTNGNESVAKKSSKKKNKNNSVWTKPTSRKNKKKAKNFRINSNIDTNNNTNNAAPKTEDTVMVTPAPRVPDRIDDSPDSKICLSKVCKAEKVELSEDRLSAGSCKGYRMVRATRGVSEGAWFFEIKVVHLGESGHTRLGWSTDRGDLQAPVGYDGSSFGYRDVDGCKVHKALRENYGDEGYKEGDVLGFYINLPEGDLFAPKASRLVLYKGQKYFCAAGSKEDPPKPVPGSEISFYKNGVCQGVAYKDLFGGRYYPAASMYTLPNQPNCVVKFNFGPDFECFPPDYKGRPAPRPMIEVPYHGYDNRAEDGVSEENKQ